MAQPSQVFSVAVPTVLKLVVTKGPCNGQTFDSSILNASFFTVGRTKKSKLCLKDTSISEKHAEIAWDGTSRSWILRDTDSSNGTFVNCTELKPYCACSLKAGDQIQIGLQTEVTVELETRPLKDATVEVLMRAYVESICQTLEGAAIREAQEMARSAKEQLDALLVP